MSSQRPPVNTTDLDKSRAWHLTGPPWLLLTVGSALVVLGILAVLAARGGTVDNRQNRSRDAAAAVAPQPAVAERPVCSGGKTYYVSPDGLATNTGTIEYPLDLAMALSDRSPAKRCDTIWLRGGTYKGAFTSLLEGASGAPIRVRQYPGERVTIDSAPLPQPALNAAGSWTWFEGLELMNSDPLRTSQQADGWPSDLRRGVGVFARGSHLKFINLVVHDLAHGFVIEASSLDTEIYGSIIYNNGWDGPQASSGHGVQSGSEIGARVLHDNIIFNQFSHGIIALGSQSNKADNMDVEGNVLFNNGIVGRTGIARDILIGGGAANTKLLKNSTYGDGRVAIGHQSACPGAVVMENYLVGRAPLTLTECTPAVKGNELYGSSDDAQTRFPENTFHKAEPTGLVVRTRANRYQPGRLHIAVYNWDGQPDVAVDISGARLKEGMSYELRDAQNFFDRPVMRGVYDGTDRIKVSMSGLSSAPPPIGKTDVPVLKTAPRFAVLVLVADAQVDGMVTSATSR
jgi:hypothetical protein